MTAIPAIPSALQREMQLPLFDPVSVPLTKGYVAYIDSVDADLLGTNWHARCGKGNGMYATHRLGRKNGKLGKFIHLHRVIMERILGRPLIKGEEVDHKDLNPLNNCRDNLRVATRSQQEHNKRMKPNNKSGYRGVRFSHGSGRWVANIRLGGPSLHLGTFDTPEAAYAAYCKAAREHFGEFARLE